jgi:hypothetical protein
MRKKVKILIILVPFGLIFSLCQKERVDFRDKYIGKYQTTAQFRSYGFPQCGYINYTKDTVISVSYGTTDSTLIVLGREVWLDSNGYYYAYHYGLHIWHDSIDSHYMNGGLGCGCFETYEGYRISDKP